MAEEMSQNLRIIYKMFLLNNNMMARLKWELALHYLKKESEGTFGSLEYYKKTGIGR